MTDQPSNDQFRASSFLQGANASYVEGLHGRFQKDPASVDQSWRDFFAALAEPATTSPSWARADWPPMPTDELTSALKARSGRKGRALFHPLRKALTGQDSGPEMGPLVRLLGRERTIARLNAAAG